jgi:hypothetical protein
VQRALALAGTALAAGAGKAYILVNRWQVRLQLVSLTTVEARSQRTKIPWHMQPANGLSAQWHNVVNIMGNASF